MLIIYYLRMDIWSNICIKNFYINLFFYMLKVWHNHKYRVVHCHIPPLASGHTLHPIIYFLWNNLLHHDIDFGTLVGWVNNDVIIRRRFGTCLPFAKVANCRTIDDSFPTDHRKKAWMGWYLVSDNTEQPMFFFFQL